VQQLLPNVQLLLQATTQMASSSSYFPDQWRRRRLQADLGNVEWRVRSGIDRRVQGSGKEGQRAPESGANFCATRRRPRTEMELLRAGGSRERAAALPWAGTGECWGVARCGGGRGAQPAFIAEDGLMVDADHRGGVRVYGLAIG
jgi:hypothetical protein